MNSSESQRELQRILAEGSLRAVFQCVVDLPERRLFGYEALIRGPSDSPLHSPQSLFDAARARGGVAALDDACCATAIKEFSAYQGEGKLFVNVSPMALRESDFQQTITRDLTELYGVDPSRIVIELSEQYPMDDYGVLRASASLFREQQFEIAIDDFGSGYSGLRAWSELRPDYVKIDRHFIENLNRDPTKREFVRTILRMARELNCRVIAEGVETLEQCNALQALGVVYAQGYFLGRPEPAPEPEDLVLTRMAAAEKPVARPARSGERIAAITESYPAVESTTALNTVLDLFAKNRQLSCLPIVDAGKPTGLVERLGVLELFVGQYSRELYGRRPIGDFMDSNAIVVADSSTYEDVSRKITSNAEETLYQHFIVTRGGQYLGVGRTGALLQRVTEQKLRLARYANPLTLLPGNVPIYERIDELLAARAEFHVAYCDLNDFKPFNDYFGYGRGDEMLSRVGQLMRDVIDEEDDFVGHIGGDDFVLIFTSPDWQQRCERLLDRLAETIPDFYSEEARAAGGIVCLSRAGEERFFPITSLAIGVCRPDPHHCQSHHDVADLASDAKKRAKELGGNAIFVSRRRRPTADSGSADQDAERIA
jgi:diguanylate cyclase (GGDEF)-like protein